ncbi:response regulator transcription factor [Nocardioides sp. 503]|uniref:helix-turn-helix transcriptional regulator n=1 Tax=Nocardioides sp. 503 TaxID=2508326 RepID=UPI0014311DB5|nr:response regulator transcription factor [Nocardioides sp. 503]
MGLLDDHDLVAAGLTGMLYPYRDRVTVVSGEMPDPALRGADLDLVLYDAFAASAFGSLPDLRRISGVLGAPIVVFTLEPQAEQVASARAAGALACLSKGLDADALVRSLTAAHASHAATAAGGTAEEAAPEPETLTQREAAVVFLIGQGLSNREVGAALFLSVNTVKSYIRLAYRKIGAASRSQAVIWAVGHQEELQGCLGSPPPADSRRLSLVGIREPSGLDYFGRHVAELALRA